MNRFSLLILMLIFAACSRKSSPDSTSSSTAQDVPILDEITGNWRIISFPYMDSVFNPADVFVVTITKNQLTFALEKNNCFIEFEPIGNAFEISQQATCTEMCCDSKEMIAFAYLLKETVTYSWQKKGAELLLQVDGGHILLKKKKKDLYSRLDGSSWTFISHGSEDVETHQKVSGHYYLEFKDRRAYVKLDVNRCNNSIKSIKGNQFTLSSPLFGCTRMCCDKKEGQDLLNKMNESWLLNHTEAFLEIRTNNTLYVLAPSKSTSTE